jgi:hypothetical protein
VTLAGSQSLAGRLARRFETQTLAQMNRYLLQNGLEPVAERYLGAWQLAPAPLGLRGFARARELTLTLERDGEVLACRSIAPAELVDDMTVIFMENGDACP